MNDMSVDNSTVVPITDKSGVVVGYEDEVNRQSVPIGQGKSQFVASAGESSFSKLTSTLKGIGSVAVFLNNPLLGLLLMTGCSPKSSHQPVLPSEDVVVKTVPTSENIEQAIKKSSIDNLVGPKAKYALVETCEVMEVGEKKETLLKEGKIEYRPVQVHLKGSYFNTSTHSKESFDINATLGVYKDQNGEWQAKDSKLLRTAASPDVRGPEQIKKLVETSEDRERKLIIDVFKKQEKASENLDVKAYLATIHENAPICKVSLQNDFNKLAVLYDHGELSYEDIDLDIKIEGNTATVHFVQVTKKKKPGGTPFRDNKMTGKHILKKSSDGSWKFYNTEIEKIEYL